MCAGFVDVEGVHKPTFWDLLPFVLYRLIVSSIREARIRREHEKQQKIRQQLLEEEEKREREKELGLFFKPGCIQSYCYIAFSSLLRKELGGERQNYAIFY